MERFEDKLSEQFGKKGSVYRYPSTNRKLPHVFSVHYESVPCEGHITACTFGVSVADQRIWGDEKIELLLQMQDLDPNWGHILGFVGNHLREKCPFSIGQVIHFGQQISESSDMTAFLVIPVTPETGVAEPVFSFGKIQKIKLVRLLPIYQSEAKWIDVHGWDTFLHRLGPTLTNPRRSRIS